MSLERVNGSRWNRPLFDGDEEKYENVESRELFPVELIGCRKVTRGINNLLYINQHILKEIEIKRKCNHRLDRLQKRQMTWSHNHG